VVDRVDVARVELRGRPLGAVSWDADRRVAAFEYEPEFLTSGLEVAPLTMPLGPGIFQFPELRFESFQGLPGLVSDSLPDRYGNDLIDAWLARQGRDRASFSSVERLCYVGSRGMGALEFHPSFGRGASNPVQVDELASLAEQMLASRRGLDVGLDEDGLTELLRVGTSAGGARAKAVIAWDPATDEVRSGQVEAPDGFEYWILKFDGVGSADHGLADPEGYGRVERAYNLMATAAGIDVAPSRIFEDAAGRAHYMAKRFDRTDDGGRIHMQTLGAVAHLDYNRPGAHSYEEALGITLRLCGAAAAEELYRRMVFNVVARNQDDHTKNISFLMGSDGRWRLSPAYDVTWAFNPTGDWTSRHQMSLAGKRDDFDRADLVGVARAAGIRRTGPIIDAVVEAVAGWRGYAAEVDADRDFVDRIAATHRLDLV
jgi:serine/threonine-protein kinase HipA